MTTLDVKVVIIGTVRVVYEMINFGPRVVIMTTVTVCFSVVFVLLQCNLL